MTEYAAKPSKPTTYLSEPVVSEGCSYGLMLMLKGRGKGKETHISIGMQRFKLKCLNLDTSDIVHYAIKLLHKKDALKDVKFETAKDFSRNSFFYFERFYKREDLQADGFIHPDGSLKFEFFIKRHNYRARLAKSEAEK